VIDELNPVSLEDAMANATWNEFDLTELLHPAEAFGHPEEVLRDPDLTLSEKRAILAAWASDACAIEAMPSLRQRQPGKPVPFDDIMDALRALDREAAASDIPQRYRRLMRRRAILSRKTPPPDSQARGSRLN
jgi:hypothetical protein